MFIASANLFAMPAASVEVVLIVMLAAGVTAISALVFVGWLCWMLIRLLADGVNHLLAVPRRGAARQELGPRGRDEGAQQSDRGA